MCEVVCARFSGCLSCGANALAGRRVKNSAGAFGVFALEVLASGISAGGQSLLNELAAQKFVRRGKNGCCHLQDMGLRNAVRIARSLQDSAQPGDL